LRGDAKPNSFDGFVCKAGELFVSGDYESATDNLNAGIQREILTCLLDTAVNVPRGVRELALKSLSLELDHPSDPAPDARRVLQSGQMMGSFLSFPLLNLVNYLTFKWLTGLPDELVRINGDDIVFRSSPEIADKWMGGVEKCGLTLSKGKTMVDRRFFTLNSALFQAGSRTVKAIPFIRPKALWGDGDEDKIGSLPGRFKSFAPGMYGKRRVLWRSIFLRENSGYIRRSCRSLTRGLGMNVQLAELKASAFWGRELRYLALPGERPPPRPWSEWSQRPEGHELRYVDRNYKRTAEEKRELRCAFLEGSWRLPQQVTVKEYREFHYTGLDLSDAICLRQVRRLGRTARLVLGSSVLFGIDKNEVTRSPKKRIGAMLHVDPSAWERRPMYARKTEWVPAGSVFTMRSEGGAAYIVNARKTRDVQPGPEKVGTLDNFETEECPVCLEDEVLVPRPCGHRFCDGCLVAWSAESSSCPLCRNTDGWKPKNIGPPRVLLDGVRRHIST
jgi:hypothetical protein